MALLERAAWYDIARTTNWTPTYVAESDLFPEVMAGAQGVPMEVWETYDEPYKTSYPEYVRIQREKDAGAYSVKAALERSRMFEDADPGWLSILKAHYGAIALGEYAAMSAEARKVRAGLNTYDDFLAGPQLVSLEGMVHCEPVALDIDVQRGHYFGDFYLVDSSEAEAHIAGYGIGNESVCWMLIGYARGYTSAFMGRPILWRETECRGMGHAKCRVVGKPVEEWEDAQDDLRFLRIGDFVKWAPQAEAPLPATSRIAARLSRLNTSVAPAGVPHAAAHSATATRT